MNCDWIRADVTAYLYDELDESDREAFERHIGACQDCSRALEGERRFLNTMSERQPLDASEALLAECRRELMRSAGQAEIHARPVGSGFLGWWRDAQRALGSMRFAWQPLGAVVLLLAGFSAGQWTRDVFVKESPPPKEAPLIPADTVLAGIHSVTVDPEQGNVEIVVEETTQRIVRGSPREPRIRKLLLSTVRGYPNSGIRLDALDILTPRVEDREVRDTLLQLMVEDENPGVRLKALEALKPRKQDPAMRKALVDVLRRDRNPGMRVQAIDLLTENPDRAIAGVLQDLMESERNNYVRLRSLHTLHELNASVDRF